MVHKLNIIVDNKHKIRQISGTQTPDLYTKVLLIEFYWTSSI